MGNFLADFKNFALKGNIVDMAVGVIIGGAFGKIVSSLVNDIIMPCFGFFGSGEGVRQLKYVVTPGQPASDVAEAVEEVAINYGAFIMNIVDFLIIAVSIFVALRVIFKLMKKKQQAEVEAPAPEPTKEEVLLTEIRDILKNK